MLFQRGDLSSGNKANTVRRRGVSTSYGTRKTKQFATLTNTATARKEHHVNVRNSEAMHPMSSVDFA